VLKLADIVTTQEQALAPNLYSSKLINLELALRDATISFPMIFYPSSISFITLIRKFP
jgi:hypothetical protein